MITAQAIPELGIYIEDFFDLWLDGKSVYYCERVVCVAENNFFCARKTIDIQII